MSATDSLILVLSIIGIIVLMIVVLKGRKIKTVSLQTTLPTDETPEEKPERVPETVIAPIPEEDDAIPLTIDMPGMAALLDLEETEEEEKRSLLEQFGPYDHKLELSSYKYPPLDLLTTYKPLLDIDPEKLAANKNKIVAILNSANIEIDAIKATIGPTIILYEIVPALGARVAKIKSLENDFALALVAYVKVTGPIPGKGTIGIEVSRDKPDIVSIRTLLSTERYQSTTMDLPVALGKTMTNEVFLADLAAMPHLLIAGATGQGKSVSMNALLVSLLYKKHPAELKLVLIDINRLELTLFRKTERHFLAKLPDEAEAVITNPSKISSTLQALMLEIEQRFELLKVAQVRNLKEYNQKFINRNIENPERHRYLPFIIIVIDEFADLLNLADKTVEQSIGAIAQRGRPVGVHLVVSTQRPSVNIITGTIKANFSSRLAFRLVSAIDSRTILDTTGAEKLNGQGDALFSNGVEITHLQGALVTTAEIERLTDFIGNQRGYPSAMLLPGYGDNDASTGDFDPENLDPMFEDAARLIVLHQQGSTSLIQRKLKLGYNRSGRILDQLQGAGIVGPFEGSKARDVLFADEYSLERHLEAIAKNKR